MRPIIADYSDAKVTFCILRYGWTKDHYQARITRPNKPTTIVSMADWDDLLFYLDTFIPKYEVNYPLPIVDVPKETFNISS